MFRLVDKVPTVYVEQSRDFQLFCRLYDTLFNSVKYDIDTIVNVLNATKANDNVLRLLCTRVGFFPRIDIDSTVLKYILASFPYIIKNKGTVKGIQGAVNAIIKAENNPSLNGTPLIEVVNKSEDGDSAYHVYISTTATIINRKALDEVLRYVLPTGYSYRLSQYTSPTPVYTKFDYGDNITIYRLAESANGAIGSKSSSVRSSSAYVRKYVGAVGTTSVVGSSNLKNAIDDLIGSEDAITEIITNNEGNADESQ